MYTLENFAHFKTLVEETRANCKGAKVICMLTGDFLSPYLLSSVDRGYGMMNALGKIPLDYITWGNHEADIDHKTVCQHVRNFPGKWINSNMLDHEAMDHQQEFDVVEITSPDGTQTRKVGLTAVLSDDPALYSHFKAPGAFGGATIDDPWETLAKYKGILEDREGCDIVVPLQHLYVPDDHKTCREFDFPVILSGHDHHRVDEVIEGSRLLKPGMNAEHATVLEISWPDGASAKPNIRSRFVRCKDWTPDPALAEECTRAYDVLVPLRNTELAPVPPSFEPLTSNGSRENVCSMGKFVCTLLKSSINTSRNERRHHADAVLLMGGNIRGNADYELGSFFSLEALEAEIKSDEVVGTVQMPGWLLAKGVEETHAGDPIPGWVQYDDGVVEADFPGERPVVTHVNGAPLDLSKVYKVATKIADLTNGQSAAWTDYYTKNRHLLPPRGSYINVHAELMAHFSRTLWQRLYEAIEREVSEEEECAVGDFDCQAEEHLDALDLSGNGIVTVDEIQIALQDKLGYSIDTREKSLANFVHSFADQNGDGRVTKKDLKIVLKQMEELNDDDNPLTIADQSKRVEVVRGVETNSETTSLVVEFPDIPEMIRSAIMGATNSSFTTAISDSVVDSTFNN